MTYAHYKVFDVMKVQNTFLQHMYIQSFTYLSCYFFTKTWVSTEIQVHLEFNPPVHTLGLTDPGGFIYQKKLRLKHSVKSKLSVVD